MIDFSIDMDFVTQTNSFLMEQTLQLVINRHNHKERMIKTGIFYSSPVLPISQLIYINVIFNKVSKTNSLITSLSFIGDLGFIVLDSTVNDIVNTLNKVAEKVIKGRMIDTVTYDLSKMKIMIYLKFY